MKKIRVTRGGCGISYEDEHGTKRHALKTPEDGPFVCDDAQADRLVRLGVAAYIASNTPVLQQEPDEEDHGNQEPVKITGHLDAAELTGWDYNELKKLAEDMGVEPKSRKKVDLIDAIMAAEVEASTEEDDMPDLNPEDPV